MELHLSCTNPSVYCLLFTLLMLRPEFSVKLGQYHSLWWPGSFGCQVISRHGIGSHIRSTDPNLPRGKIWTTYVILMLRNYIKYPPKDRNPRLALSKKQVSQCIHKISKCHRIPENEHTNPIINKVHAPTKVNGCAKYEQDPLNIVGCRVITKTSHTFTRLPGVNTNVRRITGLPPYTPCFNRVLEAQRSTENQFHINGFLLVISP